MSVLVDTNILLRSVEPMHPQHASAVGAVSRLLSESVEVYFTLQNIAEFWNVATRPVGNNGLGFSIQMVLAEVNRIESILTLLPDTPAIYAEWKQILIDRGVSGVKVHDARLVAKMKVHEVNQLLTFDVGDFARYSEIEVLHPEAVIAV